jgi:hypothetical protein
MGSIASGTLVGNAGNARDPEHDSDAVFARLFGEN